jgi:hypothetical protein
MLKVKKEDVKGEEERCQRRRRRKKEDAKGEVRRC